VTWLFLRKDSAERTYVWEYVNPLLKEEEVKKTDKEKPQEKEIYTGASQVGNKDITIIDLSEKDVSRHELWCKVYTSKEAQWNKKEKAFSESNHENSRTIALKHIHLISGCSTPYDR
jgi:hypothetical protein